MEFEAERFYVKAAEQTQDVGVRRLLGDLAEAEKGHERLAAKLTDKILKPDVREAGRQDAAARVRPAIRAAGACRLDGRIGVDAGAAVRGRLRHASELADLPGGPRRLDRRRHQHGLCGSLVRRRIADRARFALAARRDLRPDDDGRRARPYHALSGSRPTGPTRSGSRPRSPASSCSSNCGRSPTSARATWIRRSCRRCSRSCSAAPSCSRSAFSSERR